MLFLYIWNKYRNMNQFSLLVIWKILAITLFLLAICCVYYDFFKLAFIFGLCYNYVMFEVITTHTENNGDN
jgi:hypothetical protein